MDWDYNYVIAFDYDGTLCKDRFADIMNERVLRFAKKVKNMGCIIILWTSRCGYELQEAVDMCASRGLYFDYVNEYPKRTISPKVCADMYIDNKSVPSGRIPVRMFYKRLRKDLATGEYELVKRP